MSQQVKNAPMVQETHVRFLGQEGLLEEEMATHSNILDWKIPEIEQHRLQSRGLQSWT